MYPRYLNHRPIHKRVIDVVRENPGLSGSILAQRLGVQYDTLLGILPRLVRQGMLTRHIVTDPGHFRCGEMGYFMAPPQESPCP